MANRMPGETPLVEEDESSVESECLEPKNQAQDEPVLENSRAEVPVQPSTPKKQKKKQPAVSCSGCRGGCKGDGCACWNNESGCSRENCNCRPSECQNPFGKRPPKTSQTVAEPEKISSSKSTKPSKAVQSKAVQESLSEASSSQAESGIAFRRPARENKKKKKKMLEAAAAAAAAVPTIPAARKVDRKRKKATADEAESEESSIKSKKSATPAVVAKMANVAAAAAVIPTPAFRKVADPDDATMEVQPNPNDPGTKKRRNPGSDDAPPTREKKRVAVTSKSSSSREADQHPEAAEATKKDAVVASFSVKIPMSCRDGGDGAMRATVLDTRTVGKRTFVGVYGGSIRYTDAKFTDDPLQVDFGPNGRRVIETNQVAESEPEWEIVFEVRDMGHVTSSARNALVTEVPPPPFMFLSK